MRGRKYDKKIQRKMSRERAERGRENGAIAVRQRQGKCCYPYCSNLY